MHRKVSAGRGAGWIVDGIGHLSAHGGVFAGMGLLFGFLSSIPILGIPFALLGIVFQGGMISAFHSQANGATPQFGQLFDGFRQQRSFLQLLILIGISIAFAIVLVILMLVAVGPALFSMVRNGGEPSPEQVLGLLIPMGIFMVVIMPVAVVLGWMFFLSVPRLQLGDINALTALRESVSAIRANFGALFVNLLCWIALALVMMIPLVLLSLVFGLMGGTGGGGLLPSAGEFLIGALFTAVYSVIYAASMYQAWLEIFAVETPDDDVPDNLGPIQVEA